MILYFLFFSHTVVKLALQARLCTVCGNTGLCCVLSLFGLVVSCCIRSCGCFQEFKQSFLLLIMHSIYLHKRPFMQIRPKSTFCKNSQFRYGWWKVTKYLFSIFFPRFSFVFQFCHFVLPIMQEIITTIVPLLYVTLQHMTAASEIAKFPTLYLVISRTWN